MSTKIYRYIKYTGLYSNLKFVNYYRFSRFSLHLVYLRLICGWKIFSTIILYYYCKMLFNTWNWKLFICFFYSYFGKVLCLMMYTLLKQSLRYFRTRKTWGNPRGLILWLADLLQEFENPRGIPRAFLVRK